MLSQVAMWLQLSHRSGYHAGHIITWSLTQWYSTEHGNDKFGTLQWCHNECDGISNHQLHDCLLSRLFRCRSKKISKLRVTGLCVGNSLVTGEFPSQMASNVENVSMWWCHHEYHNLCTQMDTKRINEIPQSVHTNRQWKIWEAPPFVHTQTDNEKFGKYPNLCALMTSCISSFEDWIGVTSRYNLLVPNLQIS